MKSNEKSEFQKILEQVIVDRENAFKQREERYKSAGYGAPKGMIKTDLEKAINEIVTLKEVLNLYIKTENK